jgi:hypothetical protein
VLRQLVARCDSHRPIDRVTARKPPVARAGVALQRAIGRDDDGIDAPPGREVAHAEAQPHLGEILVTHAALITSNCSMLLES